MHILATETEEQAVYFGQLIHPSYSILPPSHKKLTNRNNTKTAFLIPQLTKQVLQALVLSYLDYCPAIWSGAAKKDIKKSTAG
jgi:hypothetical protein